jgi:hypothetical protein
MADALDLTTLQDVAGFLGITLKTTGTPAVIDNTDATVILLTRLITAASTFIQSHLNRVFKSASYTEYRDGSGGHAMVFAAYPVTAVSQVVVDGQEIPVSITPGAAGYVYNPTAVKLIGYRFHLGMNNVKLAYTAGYTSIPLDIAQVTVDLVARKYKERDRIGISSKVIGGENVTFITSDLTDEFKSLLRQYQKVVPV